jgi:drug/metabolite transporter (DMT)-like permease
MLGFGGVLLVARPGRLVPEGIAFALAAAVVYALYQILTRKLSSTEARSPCCFTPRSSAAP